MSVDRVKFQDIVASQLPSFVRDDFPLLSEFLEQYYVSQETQGATLDLLQNIDKYVNVDQLTDLKSSTILLSDINSVDDTIATSFEGNFTEGFVDRNGLIQIDDEIISYESKTDTSFEGCRRGFSGITSYTSPDVTDRLTFEPSTLPVSHNKGAVIKNLNVLFLQKFFTKLKSQISPGFGNRSLQTNEKNFIINSNSFYKTKGTDLSYKILFKALFGEDVEVIRPSQFLLKPSDASFSVTEDIVVKTDIGDPLDLKNLTLFQKSTGARGTVNNVSKIQYSEKDYYQLSIDSGYDRDINVKGTTYGTFIANPKTKLLNTVAVGATIMDVDSTVSFPETGKLDIIDIDGNEVSIAYTGKTVNQFLNVSGVSATLGEKTDVDLDDYAYAYVGINTNQEIRVKITSTLKNLKVAESCFYNKNDTVNIKSFGIEDESTPGSNWLVNVKSSYQVLSATLTDLLEFKYDIVTFDEHSIQPDYKIKLTDSAGSVTDAVVLDILSNKSFSIKATSELQTSRSFTVENQTLKVNSQEYSFLDKFISNVQNTYAKFNGDVMIASNSLPYYGNVPLNPFDKIVKFSGTPSANVIDFGVVHGYYTGDAVFYSPSITVQQTITPDGFTLDTEVESKFDNLDASVFYVKRVNSTSIKLSRSRSDLLKENYVTLSGTVTDNVFTYYSFYNKPLSPQGIYRQIIKPIREAGDFKTLPGYNGMFLNGVELLNYKSDDSVFYGPIKDTIITSGGSGYDIINPPLLAINDNVGTGATGTVAVEGHLERVDIVDGGFDFVNTPVVKISGGNPIKQAKAEAVTTPITYSENINTEFNGNIDIINNRIGFSSFHKFRQNERVIYDSRGLESVGGMNTDSSYFVNIIDNFTIELHNNAVDSAAGINTVDFNDKFGVGTQTIKSAERKNVVTSIIVTDPGEGYKNKKREIPVSGISTALDSVSIVNHGYETGETILYSPGSTAVQGISGGTNYFVTKIDEDSFHLSESEELLNREVYVNITGEGNGSFNYQPIVVEVNGVTGITTRGNQDFQCKVQPAFRGSIDSIDMTNQGSAYGASGILNLNRQPEFLLEGGTAAQVTVIINNGRISDIVIDNAGSGYVSPPNLIINGTGKFAKLTPIITGGKLTEIKIINPGLNYVAGQTTITIQNPGVGCQVEAKIMEWNVNLFERDSRFVDNDDSFIDENISGDKTQYCHLYTPRQLREKSYVLKNNGDRFFGLNDLQKDEGVETDGSFHSPILGWAYDGNPIYGPSGYSTPSGGVIRQLKSGYELSLDLTHRPPLSLFPEGFFVEDFKFTNSGDLDVHNGRFCVTPDYPEGTYAYFTSLESFVESSGPFKNYKKPQFPYVIGDTFHSKRIEFNYSSLSNQTDYDIESNEWFRNTKAYNTNDSFSGYDYIFDSNKIKKQTIDVTSASSGTISGVGIFTGGSNYQVNDNIRFNNTQSEGKNARAKVSFVDGKEIVRVSTSTTTISDIEFANYFSLDQFVGFSSLPHNFEDKEIINISGLSDYYKGFDGQYNIGVRTETFVTTLGIASTATTGFTTYFYVGGALEFPFIRPNDILGIGTEKVKVLNVDKRSERIRVLRAQDGTIGVAHSAGDVLLGEPRSFTINVGSLTTEKSFRLNEELYFEPVESVGLGTNILAGIGTVITFKNPGVGATTIFVQQKAIYYKDHGLRLNDKVSYSPNSGTSIVVFNGISTSNLSSFGELFATPITKDLIGISSHKVGLATDGGYVGIGTTTGLFSYETLGTGDYHSFKTLRTDILRAQGDRHIVTVSTASTHGLQANNNVRMSIKPTSTQTIDVRYNDFNRRIVFDPVGFTSDKVDTTLNTLQFDNHDFSSGDKVIHTSNSPAGGLVNEAMYYVVPYNKDKIRLVSDKFQIDEETPNFINITTQGLGGTISRINPLVKTRKNNTLKFDLSDESLSFLSNSVRYPAFKMSVYLDQEFNKEFVTTGKKEDRSFEVTSGGTVGIDANANLTIEISDFVSNRLYYKFDTINPDIITKSKRGLIIDSEVSPFNQINVEKSKYDGNHKLTGAGGTIFTFDLPVFPESNEYTQSDSVPTYITDSTRVYGSIAKIEVTNAGGGYKNLPKVIGTSIGIGTGAILEAQTKNIGKVLKTRFDSDNIGFDYPTDNTIRPVANLPEILEMESLTSFESIGITSFGRNYLHPAELVVIDGYTNKVLPEVDLRYELGDTSVTILKNTTGMYDITPRIIPTQNSNGVRVSSVSYDNTTKVVRLNLDTIFDTPRDFPYNVGTNIFVENISVGLSTGRGYNSADYNYTLFPVITAVPQFGGTGAYIEYSLKDLIGDGEVPGTLDPLTNLGQVVSEDYFPIFTTSLHTNDFFKGEKVFNGTKIGTVESWVSNIEQLKVDTSKDFDLGTVVRGESSNTQAVILKKYDFDAEITTGVGATVFRGWQNNTGFLNDNLQVIPNNEYYQNFSYSLSSRVPYDTWDDPVSNLNHTSGFAKFSDYQLVSQETNPGDNVVKPIESNIEVVIDIIGEGDLNCFYDFDFVSEGTQSINGVIASDEIFFENRILTDYFQSVGNRVLSIDDISGFFNSNERAEQFEPIASYESNYVFNKVFTFARDTVFTDERQFSIVNVLQDGTGYVNEYATIETYPTLGFYDYLKTGDGWDLTFNPVKFEYNSYLTSAITISLLDGVVGTGSSVFGDIVTMDSEQVTIPTGTTTTIATFPTTNRAAKIITMVEATSGIASGQYDATEINIIHDGTTVTKLEYGDVQSIIPNFGSIGLGTYYGYIDGSNVKVDFIPGVTGPMEAQTSKTLISDSNVSAGSTDLNIAKIKSTYTSISASGSPSANVISTYTDPFAASYNVVVVKDTTNNNYEMFEFAMCDSSTNQTFVEYGNISNGGGGGGGTVTDYSEVTLSGLSPSSFNQTYVRQSTGFVLDTDTAGSGNALLHEDSNYYYYVASTGPANNNRALIYSTADSKWVTIFTFSIDFTEGNISNNQAIGSVFTDDVTASGSTGDGRNVPTASSDIVYATTSGGGGGGGNLSLGQVGVSSVGTNRNITYTPNASIDVEVRTFGIDLKIYDELVTNDEIDQNNVIITGDSDSYRGTKAELEDSFGLLHKGNQIFRRVFDGASASNVNTTNETLALANHFFVSGERVIYSHNGTAIGIATTTVGGISTDKLPSELFVIKIDEGNIRFAETAEKALSIIPDPLKINSVGVGNSHVITATNQNSKVLVAVDNMIQAPIAPSDVTTTLHQNILFETIFDVTGITSFASGDILRIGNEYLIAEAVGIAGSTKIGARRAQLGSTLSHHNSGDTITKITGNYNIVGNNINFASAPYGNTPLSTTSAASPDQRDWAGITTSSSFQGRSFMRRSPVGSTNETYSRNIVFDDVSTKFNGITTEFTLKNEGSNTVGYSTNNGIVLINNIFQVPEGSQPGDGSYQMEESVGVTSVSFTGIGVSNGYDPNNSNIPLGGLIVSVGSESGFGYQPLMAAGGTVSISTTGTVSAIGIANSGSGYRNGVQLVSVGIRPSGGSDLVAIGTATISGGHITDVTVSNTDVFYAPRDVSNVGYSSITGVTTVTTSTAHGLSMGDEVTLSGIAFTCDYPKSLPVNITNVVYDNVTGIMTVTTSGAHNLQTSGQRSDVLLTGIAMTCGLDGGASTHVYPRTTDPYYCGSRVTAVNSSTEFVTNVGVSTVPTFYQSGGVAQPVLIAPRTNNHSASGTDPASDSTTILEVIDSTTFIVNTGISTRTHFYARCGKVGRPFDVVFDDPLSYSNIPLEYSSTAGVGQSATVNIVVGQGSSVINFDLGYTGFGYGNDEVLTVPVGGPTGIPTDPSLSFSKFEITIEKIFTDNFNAFTVGELQVLDKFDDLFDGFTKDFRLLLNSNSVSIQANKGSSIEVDQTLLIFINDILQEPGKGYVFSGGSTVEFTEPPKVGDTSKVLFYKGGGDVDVIFTDIIETIKVGDTLNINNNPPLQGMVLDQNPRTIVGINTLDSVKTNTYEGPGVTSDRSIIRPVTWCKQTSDKIINGKVVGKDRILYEPQIYPTSYLIQPVGLGSTEAYVDNVRPLFNPTNENQVRDFQKIITLTSQDSVVGATATAVVSAGGTISSISITNAGVGYTFTPTITIGSVIGMATTATATVSVTSGSVTSVTITNPGAGYTGTVPVIIESPTITNEVVNVSSYEGDFGNVIGIGTTNSGAQEQLFFDLFIPKQSFMRSNDLVGTGITISGISTGDFLTIFDTNVSIADTFASQDESGVSVGIGTTFVDNIYKAISVERKDENVTGVGVTAIQRVTVNIDKAGSIGFTTGSDIGNYSWGKIMFEERPNPKPFSAYTMDGVVSISTGGVVSRTNPLKFNNYV